MKLPSIETLIGNAFNTFNRFCLAIVSAIVGSIFCILLSHLDYSQKDTHQWYLNAALCSYLSMLLQVAIVVYSERKELSKTIKLSIKLVGVICLIAYYFSLPKSITLTTGMRFALFSLGLHWLIAFIPFIKNGEINAFWQYNKIIFLRILTSFLYTGVLYTGLALAILAVQKLFSVKIDNDIYADLWIVLTGIFNTWLFLAGFPTNYSKLEDNSDYPKGLKIFTQYVLLPIITIYLLILYAYMGKIVYTHQWPMGWVSYLVLFFSVAGILSLLLIHPVRFEANNKWILTYSRFFYYAIFPLLILLFFAIKKRISDYGITELRYFVLLLALWLLFIATYFSISKHKNIKLIPQSLCLLAFLSSFGPWGAFGISLNSQKSNFESILTKNNLLINGKAIKATKQPSFNDRKQLSSVVEYIISNHGYKTLQPYFVQNLDTLIKENAKRKLDDYTSNQEKVLSLMCIKYVANYESEEADTRFDYRDSSENITDVKGFDYVINNYSFENHDNKESKDTAEFKAADKKINICFDPHTNILTITESTNLKGINFDLNKSIDSLTKLYQFENKHLPMAVITLDGVINHTKYRLIINHIYGDKVKNRIVINNLGGSLLIGNISGN